MVREINTDIPVSGVMGGSSRLTPVEERRQWLEEAFSKKHPGDSKEKNFRSPNPPEGIVHDRVRWLKRETEKYSKTVIPENVTRKRFSDGGAVGGHRTDPVDTRNDLDEDLQGVKSVAPSRHSFPTSLASTELQVREEPQDFLFPLTSNGAGVQVAADNFPNTLQQHGFPHSPPPLVTPSQHVVSSASAKKQSGEAKSGDKNDTDADPNEDPRLRQLIPFSDSPYYRQYENDRVCTLSPASANSLSDYAHLNSGVMAMGKVEGIVSDDPMSQKRMQVRSWRQQRAEKFVDGQFNSDYISFRSPMGSTGEPHSMVAKNHPLDPHVVENQCFDSCGCAIL